MSARNTILFSIQNWYLWSVAFKFSQWCFWDSWILVYCGFSNYCNKIKEKLHFSLICSFYCCLLKEGLSPKSCLGASHIPIFVRNASWWRKLHNPPPPTICVISRFSTKSIFFKKIFQKIVYIFEEPLNLNIILFFFFSGFQENIEPSRRNYLILTTQFPRYTEYTYYFLISNCSNASDFFNWR